MEGFDLGYPCSSFMLSLDFHGILHARTVFFFCRSPKESTYRRMG